MTSQCQNCDWAGPDEDLGRQLEDVPDLLSRVSPGEPMPTGECPRCGALCQPIEEDEYKFTITIQVTASSFEQAAEHALDDLRDPAMEWTDYTITNTTTGETQNVKGLE